MSSKLVTQGTTLSMTANQQSFTQGLVSPSDHSLQFKTHFATSSLSNLHSLPTEFGVRFASSPHASAAAQEV